MCVCVCLCLCSLTYTHTLHYILSRTQCWQKHEWWAGLNTPHQRKRNHCMKKQHTGQHCQCRAIHPCDEAVFSFLLFAELISIGQITYKLVGFQNLRGIKSQRVLLPWVWQEKCHDKKDLGIFLVIFPPTSVASRLKFVPWGLSQFEATPGACDEQSFLFVRSFIISITKRRIEDNYIVWTNQSVRRVFVMVAECSTWQATIDGQEWVWVAKAAS